MKKKSMNKAVVLEFVYNSDMPVTIGSIKQATLLPYSTIKDCLARLLLERCVEKKKFTIEGINPLDYRVNDRGRTPRYYYILRPLGLKKLKHFDEIGIIELQ